MMFLRIISVTVMFCLLSSIEYSFAAVDNILKLQVVDDKPWWLDSTIQAAGIFITAWFVIWQIKKQRENTIRTEEIKFKNEINYQIYQKISAEISASQQYTYSHVLTMTGRFQNYNDISNAITTELSSIEGEYKNSFNQVLKVLSILEDYEITLTNLTIFSLVISTMLDELRQKHFDLWFCLHETRSSITVTGIQPDQIINLKLKCDDVHETWLNLTSYLFDLSVECQNQLLGEIFKCKVNPRKPLDPKYMAISSNTHEVVEFFKNSENFMARWAEHTARHGDQRINQRGQ